MRDSRKFLLIIFTISIAMFLASAGISQSSLSDMKDKDLFKKAEKDAASKLNKLEDAREALLIIIERAEAKKKKPNKKYVALFDSVNRRLGEREAAAGAEACGRKDFAACQERLAVAKKYDDSTTIQLEAALSDGLTQLRQDFQSTVEQGENGVYEAALKKLDTLFKYEEFLPNVKSEAVRIQGMQLKKLNGEGLQFIEGWKWDDATSRFNRVLGIDPENEIAKTGLATTERGREATGLASQASEMLNADNFKEAKETALSAKEIYPEAEDTFVKLVEQIDQTWIGSLLTGISGLIRSGELDFVKSRNAYLRLQKVLELDPSNPSVPMYVDSASMGFATNAAQRAQEYAADPGLSRIATATVLKFGVRQHIPELFSPEDMKDVMGKFNRKRIAQLVLSVENVGSGATEGFTRNIQARAESIIDKLSLKDLRLRDKDDYERDPRDDLQFQSLRPDGKSYTALMTVNITKCDWRRKSVDRSAEVKSTYVDGTRQEINPEWEEQSGLVDAISGALNDPAHKKKDKPTKEGYTTTMLVAEKDKLSRISQFLEKDNIVEYPYRRIEYTQNTDIEIEIMLRDYGSRQVIAEKTIEYSNMDKGVEISGIKDRDQNQLLNQPLRLPEKEESLDQGLRYVRENIDTILPSMLHSYTNRFFFEGEKSNEAGRVSDAVEAYLCHWASYGNQMNPERAERVNGIIKRELGFDLEKNGSSLMSELLKVLQ